MITLIMSSQIFFFPQKGEFRVNSTKLSSPWARPECILGCPQLSATSPQGTHHVVNAGCKEYGKQNGNDLANLMHEIQGPTHV